MTQRWLNDLIPNVFPCHALFTGRLHKPVGLRLPYQRLRPAVLCALTGAMIVCMAIPTTAGAAGGNSTFVAGQTSPCGMKLRRKCGKRYAAV